MNYYSFNQRKLSRIALGCDHFGEDIPALVALKEMDYYYQEGGNLFDTARAYGQSVADGPSTSEQVVGKWIQANGCRENIILATKGGLPPKNDMHKSRLTEKCIRFDVETSLQQLKVNKVDIWFLHRDNPAMGVDEIVDLVNEEVVAKGYTTYLGLSNWKSKRIEQANEWAKKHNRQGFSLSEIQDSLAYCTPQQWNDDTIVCMDDHEELWYKKNNFPVLAFASQAKGFFSKILNGGMDELSQKAKERFVTERNLAMVPKVEALSQELKVSVAALCVAYLTSQEYPVFPIIGSSKLSQIKDSLSSADLILTKEQLGYLKSGERA